METKPQTFSQALLNLGKIRAVEDPITFGLLAFYKAENIGKLHEEEAKDMQRYLEIFVQFCSQFEKIVSFEQKQDLNSLEKWLMNPSKNEKKSRVDTFVGIHTLSEKEKIEMLKDLKLLCGTAQKLLKKDKVKTADIKKKQQILEKLREKLREKLNAQRRTSEKIISGSVPSIYYGSVH